MREVMRVIAEKSGNSLKEHKTQERLEIGGWQMLTEEGTEDWSGRIKIRMGGAHAVKVLEDTFQGSSIRLGELKATLRISNAAMAALPKCNSNYAEGAPTLPQGGAPTRL